MKPYYEQDGIMIYHGDCREIAPQLVPSDLVVTSPPYAKQRDYGFKRGEFIWEQVVPRALANVNISTNGQVLVNLGLIHKDGEVVTYWDALTPVMRAYGFRLFGWYQWDQGSGLPGDWNGRFAPSHEFVFHFNKVAKSPNKTVQCKTYGRTITGTGLRGRAHTKGRFSHQGADVQPFKIPDSVIRVNREMARNIGGHPAPFPVEFAEFLIRAFDGSVLDPFMGGGSTLIAARKHCREAVGIEIEERYCEIAANRLAKLNSLTLEQPA